MNSDKLNQAAREYVAFETKGPGYDNCILGFMKGARWLMQQPLSERLTEEEKEKIKEIYFSNRPMTNWVNVDKKVSTYVLQLLEAIFGPDLFKEKQP